jgi:vacuolar-type H+-ATPase subunit H
MIISKLASAPEGADNAINRVLEAERAAQAEIVECRRQALAILREARARARAVSARADRRTGRIRHLCDQAVERELAAIAVEAHGLATAPRLTPELSARLDKALERLVTEILA